MQPTDARSETLVARSLPASTRLGWHGQRRAVSVSRYVHQISEMDDLLQILSVPAMMTENGVVASAASSSRPLDRSIGKQSVRLVSESA